MGALSAQYQQNVVSLYNAFTTTQAASQAITGSCTVTSTAGSAPLGFWDIGVRGDLTLNGHESGVTLAPTYSVITSTTGYASTNIASNPNFVSQYCDGSRTPPEFGASGWAVPPGIADATVPNPIFNLTPVATVDEGNNWINLRWGPLSLLNPVTNTALGNYSVTAGSPVIDYIPRSAAGNYPQTDFFGNPRPDPGSGNSRIDIGAVEFQVTGAAVLTVTPTSLTFGSTNDGSVSNYQTLTLSNTGGANATGISLLFTGPFERAAGGGTACGTTLAAGANCTIRVAFAPTAGQGTQTGTLAITASATVTGSPVSLTGTAVATPTLTSITPSSGAQSSSVPVTLNGTNLTGATWSTATTGTYANINFGALTVNAAGTSATATLTISATTTLGNKSLSLTVGTVNTNNVMFTIVANPLAPTLTSIAPTSGARGTVVPVTLTGTNLTGATWSTATTGAYINIGFGALTVNTAGTSATANLTISPATSLGGKNLSVTTSNGTTGTVAFGVVNPPVATLTSISPNSSTLAQRGTTVSVTLTGTNFTTGSTVAVSGTGITVSGVNVVSSTQITANFAISAGTGSTGAHNVRVTNASGTASNPAVTFTKN